MNFRPRSTPPGRKQTLGAGSETFCEQELLRVNLATATFMVVIRCTQKLLRRVRPLAGVPPPSTTKLGDWVGKPVGAEHQRVLLFISERFRLPVVLPARDVRNVAHQLPLAVGVV